MSEKKRRKSTASEKLRIAPTFAPHVQRGRAPRGKPFLRPGRRGLNLLELLAVVAILGLFATLSAARFGPAVTKTFAAHGDARRLALDLRLTQRHAIATGDNHYITFSADGLGNLTGYSLYRRLSAGGTQLVDGPRDFPQAETVTTTADPLEYAFDGTALAAYTVTFTGPSQTWQVSVVPVTGAVRVVQVSP